MPPRRRKARTETPDAYVMRVCCAQPNLLVAHFLIHSFLYYVEDQPIISDDTFDWVVKQLGELWERIEHPHKGLLDPSLLKSGFYLKDYPSIVVASAADLKSLMGLGNQ